jgi:Mor family transcriptional regulator
MTLAVRNYSSGAENIATAHAIRQKLMKPANAYRPPVVAIVVSNPPPVRRRFDLPLWKRKEIDYNEHVKAWEWNRVPMFNRTRKYIATRCAELGVDCDEIIGMSLSRTATEPRSLIWYELRTNFGMSYPAIAREFSGRDHTTIMFGVKRIAKLKGLVAQGKANSLDRLVKDRDLNDLVHQDFRLGMSMMDLAIKYDLSAPALTAIVKIEKWERDKRDKNNTSRSARINYAELRREWESGVGVQRLVAWHGVSERTIRRLVRDNGWTRKGKE